jgi:hypothetical protein
MGKVLGKNCLVGHFAISSQNGHAEFNEPKLFMTTEMLGSFLEYGVQLQETLMLCCNSSAQMLRYSQILLVLWVGPPRKTKLLNAPKVRSLGQRGRLKEFTILAMQSQDLSIFPFLFLIPIGCSQ